MQFFLKTKISKKLLVKMASLFFLDLVHNRSVRWQTRKSLSAFCKLDFFFFVTPESLSFLLFVAIQGKRDGSDLFTGALRRPVVAGTDNGC